MNVYIIHSSLPYGDWTTVVVAHSEKEALQIADTLPGEGVDVICITPQELTEDRGAEVLYSEGYIE